MVKKAFTMVELVMVIVVLGIVASIGADIIAKLYENYLKTRSIERLQSQTELVLDQIAKRLNYRIKDSVIARSDVLFTTYVPLPDANESFKILEWIGKSNESFLGESNGTVIVPGWSGFIDLDSNETNSTNGFGRIHTKGSRLDFANNIINALSYDKVDLNGTTTQRPAIILKGKDSYDIAEYGWGGIKGEYTHKVQSVLNSTDILQFVDVNDTPNTLFEQYNLAWSAYAIIPEFGADGSTNDFNLTLKYNYQPWYNERYDDNDTESIVLIEHASTFRFTQIGETIRIKLCIGDDNRSGDYNFAFCKERVVF